MKTASWLYNKTVLYQYKKLDEYLKTSSPEKILADGEKKLIKAFKNSASCVPFYKRFLLKQKISSDLVKSLSDFKKQVPFLDKEKVFLENDLKDICRNGQIDDVCLFYSSSGSSGVFSFGAETWKNRSRIALGLEFLLDHSFDIFKKKTLLINCLPMGVKVFTRTLPLAETSVREDVVLSLLEKLKNYYDQFIIVGESAFLKHLAEFGAECGTLFKDLKINLITGGEFIPETYRSYMAELLDIDLNNPESGIIAVNMGLSELSLSLFSESTECINIRRAALKNKKLRKELFKNESELPLLMQYFPSATWLENIGDNNELIVSMLDPNLKIPLIRYNTKDRAELVSYNRVKEILQTSGSSCVMPKYKLPFGIVTGKNQKIINNNGESLGVNEVKEALYFDFDFASCVTGNFRLFQDGDFIIIYTQLKKNIPWSEALCDKFFNSMKNYTNLNFKIVLKEYIPFYYGIEHNFEKKNKYISA